ncbi:MarR family transcriptional regulator [Trinickia caryophylli]|uniref:Transcriptional regulator, MarR family n=1 Tax=Trinickia caryophylli TaxID=28094 RepID=A0A1X7G970_TRICW|nr:MarR family transcriptional regulator [Trinickia caryophylli]PMS11398.1 MarR family transcriptional regulator [Trinickia caryophylli]TRX17593.1 MarR family transcriptional regulator [Trinickia caryophylli]WQE11654.1 MarR family transcriptional regulator [Trinickia caryophylli]SMF66129.1 transcriptional regulator, MarR family [Trinickia caryophylli]GLU34839.1 MarR family transcriptional regulator [Trinickia caryophylli]
MAEPTDGLPPEVRDFPLDEAVGYLLARAKSGLSNLVSQRTMSELGITSTQGSMLFMIGSGRCPLAADLARHYGIDASAVTRLVDRLEKRKLLSRVRSSEDRRAVRLELTADGYALAARMPEIFGGVTEKALAGFTPEEIGFLKSMLRRMLANTCEAAAGGS